MPPRRSFFCLARTIVLGKVQLHNENYIGGGMMGGAVRFYARVFSSHFRGARCRRIRRHGVRRTHDRERQSMFLPRALKGVKCFSLGEVTRKENNTKRGRGKVQSEGRIFIISFRQHERGEKRSFLLAVLYEKESCCAFCKNNVSFCTFSDMVIQRDGKNPSTNHFFLPFLFVCVCVYIYIQHQPVCISFLTRFKIFFLL